MLKHIIVATLVAILSYGNAFVAGLNVAKAGFNAVPMMGAGGRKPPTAASCAYAGGNPTAVSGGNGNASNNGTANQVASGISIGAAAPCRVVFTIINAGTGTALSTLTMTPNVGAAAQPMTIIAQTGGGAVLRQIIASGVLDSSADTATTVSINLTYVSSVFAGSNVWLWYAPATAISSLTPVGNCTGAATTNTVISCNMATTSGGFAIAAAASDNTTSNIGTISGTETYTNTGNIGQNGLQTVAGTSNGVSTNASSAATATYTQSGNLGITAASWK